MRYTTPLALSLAAAALGCPLALRAQTIQPVAVLTCQGPNNSSLSEPLFQFSFSIGNDRGIYEDATVVSDVAAFTDFFTAQQAGTTYAACTVDGGAASFILHEVQIYTANLLVFGQGVLAPYYPSITGAQGGSEVSLCFESFTLNGITYAPTVISSCFQEAPSNASPESRGQLTGTLVPKGR